MSFVSTSLHSKRETVASHADADRCEHVTATATKADGTRADRIERAPAPVRHHDGATESKRLERLVGATPVGERVAARATIPHLMGEMHDQGVTDPHQQAYVLATTEHESHFGANGFDVEISSGRQYEHRADLGNVVRGDGPKYKGHGDVQITGRAAYTYYAHKYGVDLVGHPEHATEPALSAKIAVDGMKRGTYTSFNVGVRHLASGDVAEDVTAGGGHKLDDYIYDGHVDYVGARAIINGHDNAHGIARQAEAYARALLQR